MQKLSRNIDLSNGGYCNDHNNDHDNVDYDDDDDNVDDDDNDVHDQYGRGQNSNEPVLKTVQHKQWNFKLRFSIWTDPHTAATATANDDEFSSYLVQPGTEQ